MTLITTSISKYGIIQTADSNLTDELTGQVSAGPKVFPLGFTDAALAMAGAYYVDSESMETWLPRCIADYSNVAAPSMQGFANHLAAELQACATAAELRLFHIAGYVDGPNGAHPEFYFVRNAQGINATGDYEGITSTYLVTEDFWSRDYQKIPRKDFEAGEEWRYFNGFPHGRIAYVGAMQRLTQFYREVWQNPGWEFRQPANLGEIKAFARLNFQLINTLFVSSDYPAPYIGGEIRIETIPAPAGRPRP